MLSDFGTSRDMIKTSRVRSGNTGTSVPEILLLLLTSNEILAWNIPLRKVFPHSKQAFFDK